MRWFSQIEYKLNLSILTIQALNMGEWPLLWAMVKKAFSAQDLWLMMGYEAMMSWTMQRRTMSFKMMMRMSWSTSQRKSRLKNHHGRTRKARLYLAAISWRVKAFLRQIWTSLVANAAMCSQGSFIFTTHWASCTHYILLASWSSIWPDEALCTMHPGSPEELPDCTC